jgi:hypothetical protein
MASLSIAAGFLHPLFDRFENIPAVVVNLVAAKQVDLMTDWKLKLQEVRLIGIGRRCRNESRMWVLG